jgi:hypothetical protein
MATLALSALAPLALLLTSCTLGAEDVPFTVTVTNNTPNTIVDHTFFGAPFGTKGRSRNFMEVTLPPGRSFGDSEFYNEGVDFDRITTLSGQTLGCLPFKFSEEPPTTLDVKVTQAIQCRHWSKYGSNRKDWPNPKY